MNLRRLKRQSELKRKKISESEDSFTKEVQDFAHNVEIWDNQMYMEYYTVPKKEAIKNYLTNLLQKLEQIDKFK